jgi:hypothetical protein
MTNILFGEGNRGQEPTRYGVAVDVGGVVVFVGVTGVGEGVAVIGRGVLVREAVRVKVGVSDGMRVFVFVGAKVFVGGRKGVRERVGVAVGVGVSVSVDVAVGEVVSRFGVSEGPVVGTISGVEVRADVSVTCGVGLASCRPGAKASATAPAQ